MRITLDLDDDVLVAVNELARRESRSLADAVSGLLRESLASRDAWRPTVSSAIDTEFGFRPFPKRGGSVTNALIDRLRDGSGD